MHSLNFDSERKLVFKEMTKDRSGLKSVFIKRVATRSVILRVWDIPTRLHRWKSVHLCIACEVTIESFTIFRYNDY